MSVFIRDDLRVLYIHVPKTGGTAVEFFFEKNGFLTSFIDRGGDYSIVPMMKCSPQHMHAEQLHAVLHVNRFSYRFMTVRHPVARLLSEYRMRAIMQESIEDVDTWIGITLDACAKNPFVIDNHIRPQVEFWVPGCDVFKHEDGFGEAWVRRVAEQIGCEFLNTEVDVVMRFPSSVNATPSATSLARVRDFYQRDFEVFGYDPNAAA